MPPSCGVKNLADGNSMAKYLAILVLWRIILSGERIRRKVFFRGEGIYYSCVMNHVARCYGQRIHKYIMNRIVVSIYESEMKLL